MTEPALIPVSPAISSAVERLMRRVEDFPSAGVQFCDLTPVFADADGFDAVVAGLIAGHEIGSVDYVAGLDARGFLLAGAAAVRLHTGVLAIRKAGKLPPPVHSRSYELEYGAATLELPADGLDLRGKRVLVVDDVLATGGLSPPRSVCWRTVGRSSRGCPWCSRSPASGGGIDWPPHR